MVACDTTAALVEDGREEMVATRRLHREPELSTQEVNTAAFIAARLREIDGVERIREGVGGTGVTAVIRGAGPGRTLLRADTDAPHHHPRFDIAEESLPVGAAVFAETALQYLSA